MLDAFSLAGDHILEVNDVSISSLDRLGGVYYFSSFLNVFCCFSPTAES